VHPNEKLLADFYSAFAARDHAAMARAYDDGATFTDPVFPGLDAEHVRGMWRMFCSGGNVEVTHGNVKADDTKGSARWEARYKFPGTGRPVHNKIRASFEFKDGRIVQHTDAFPFYRWARMALGAPGLLLGWSGLVRGRVRSQAAAQLDRFMEGEGATPDAT
jgi:hypothetical protein